MIQLINRYHLRFLFRISVTPKIVPKTRSRVVEVFDGGTARGKERMERVVVITKR